MNELLIKNYSKHENNKKAKNVYLFSEKIEFT